MSGAKKGKDLSQFNYGAISSLVVNQGESLECLHDGEQH